ncbi:MAG: hypothetical protein IPN13_20420 [Bacteroidetes bacterium]|nr:hypothetical protein [Bacteroidota bacterium]MBK7391399.1 hypothetical protein [Bacteroidota bacterium]MBK8876110.1 hypothetical protein [Bacteroidota bacterium]
MITKLYMKFFLMVVVICIATTINISAQQLTAANLQHLPQRGNFNPAYVPHGTVNVGIPFFSGFGFNFSNNGFRYNDLIKRRSNDSLYLDAESAINQMQTRNRILFDLEIDWFSFGVRAGSNYFNLSIRERANINFEYSKALIEFLYYGNAGTLGTLQHLNPGIESSHYREYAINWARPIARNLRGGIKLKYLYGMENIHTKGTGVTIYTDPEDFTITANSDLAIYTSGIDTTAFKDFSFGNYALGKSNNGFGADIGLIYRPLNNLEIGVSMLDLGSIKWRSNITNYSTSTADGAFTYQGIDIDEFINNDSTSAQEYLENLADSIYSTFDVQTNHESYKSKLPRQLLLNVSYYVASNYKVGIMIRNKRQLSGNYTDYQLSFTGATKTWLNYTVAMNKINQSPATIGGGLVLNFKNDQVYFVSDNVPGLFNWKNSFNTGFRAGINFVLGRNPKPVTPPQPTLPGT